MVSHFDRSLLVLGGARSGKSRYAQAMAEATEGRLIFIATAQPFDPEMTARIDRHRADRDDRWLTCEAPIDLAEAIADNDGADSVMLVDCLTLWTSNLLLADRDIGGAVGKLVDVIHAMRGKLVLVANEVGWGIVPDNALARRFRDEAGLINQTVAAAASQVDLVVAGLPMRLKL